MGKSDKKYIELLGKRIRERREQLGLSLLEFARNAELGKGQASKIEHGKNATTITVLRRVAAALDISLSELVDF